MTLIPIIWGTTFAVVKVALPDVTPVLFGFARFGFAALCFLIFFPKTRRAFWILFEPISKEEKQVRNDVLILGVTLGAGYIFQFIGLMTTTTSKSAFLTSTTVIWTPIIAYSLGKEAITSRLVFAVLISILGILFLSKPFDGPVVIGDILTVLCAISFGFYIVFIDQAFKNARKLGISGADAGLLLSAMQLMVATLLMGIAMPLLEEPRFVFTTASVAGWAYTALLGTGLTIYLQTRYQDEVSPSLAAIIYMLEPVVAAIIGYLLLAERMGMSEVAGAILIIFGVIIAQLKLRPETRVNIKE